MYDKKSFALFQVMFENPYVICIFEDIFVVVYEYDSGYLGKCHGAVIRSLFQKRDQLSVT